MDKVIQRERKREERRRVAAHTPTRLLTFPSDICAFAGRQRTEGIDLLLNTHV